MQNVPVLSDLLPGKNPSPKPSRSNLGRLPETGIWPGTAFIATWRFDADPHGFGRGFAKNFTWALTHTPGRNFLEGGVL